MKTGIRGWERAGLLAVVFLFIASCGSSSSVSADISSGGGGTGISNMFDSPAEMGVGDIMAIELGDSMVTVDFTGVASDANFILAVGSGKTSGGASSIRLSTSAALPEEDPVDKAMEVEGAASEDDGYGPQEILSAWLRANESLLPDSETPAVPEDSLAMSKAMQMKASSVGDVESFRVLSSLTSVNTWADVTAEARCVGANVVFFVDEDPRNTISEEQVQALCAEFDEVAGAEKAMLGELRDPDGDDKLHVLMTPQVNCLGALGGGIITGYFYAGDLYARSGSNQVSNYRDIIYTMVPAPGGISCSSGKSATISDAFAMSNLLPAVLPHEMQHAISYNQHVFVAGGQPEENWLNEGMSHLVEDVMGFGVENPSRYSMYLASPSTYGVVTQSSPNLMERGAAYLFLRFLYEQAEDGAAFLRKLSQSSSRGVANVEEAFAGPAGFSTFSEFMARWTVALAMTDRGISQDPRYTYKARTRAATGNWEGVLLAGDAEDNRGTQLAGVHLNQYYGSHNPSIDASTAMYYNVTTIPNQMRMEGTAGGGDFGILIRTR